MRFSSSSGSSDRRRRVFHDRVSYRSLLFSDRESVTGRNYLPTCSSLFILAFLLLLLLEAKRNPPGRKGANPSFSPLPLQLSFRLIPAGQLSLSLINLGARGRNRMRPREEIEHAPLLLLPRFVVRKISGERERHGITVQGRHAIILGTALTSGLPVIPI